MDEPFDPERDLESQVEAKTLSSWLRSWLEGTVERSNERPRFAPLSSDDNFPLWSQLSKTIPLVDIQQDVEDFAALLIIARLWRTWIFCIRIGEEKIPLLPPVGVLTWIVRQFAGRPYPPFYGLFEELAYNFSSEWYVAGAFPVESAVAKETFFKGLTTFLAHRIAGARWWRRNHGNSGSSGNMFGAGGNGRAALGSTSSGGGGAVSGQWWTVNCVGSGYSVYYAGTHAARNPPNYLSGVTTPLPVFLPMGTLHLAANAGHGGRMVWDPSVVTVPSNTPTFHTKVF